ncbi:ABC transporter [Compostibacillus humi]|uniref:ABC transporter n=1 Tax=Compostibacillus humi TaxID=1245525 RepID=A0A8J2TPS1_9BACI|nr:ABC transporter ATP-binding protein [Compostibacillus humi]GFZ80523.1 ABC transporter [Compostibacillus humi]
MNVSCSELLLKYGNHIALDHINFEIQGEKIYGLLGRNGAGKTSLLSIMASFRKQTAGSITINGEDPFENSNIMEQIVFMYSKNYSEESETIQNMLKSAQRYRPNFDKDYAEYLIGRFQLDVKKPIKKLSKGMQSAFNVTIGLASRAPITILDEVYLGMDAPSRDIFYKELLQEQERHPRMFILSTHLVSEMEYLFDEVILINKGKLLLHEDFDTLVSKGATITGDKEIVDDFVRSKKCINEQQLGGTKSVMIFGELTEVERNDAIDRGLEVTPVPLQDLFIHLTKEEDANGTKSRLF